MEIEKFITVLTATYGYEIAVIRGRLESEDITCFVKDELTVQVNPFYSNAIGGVKLQVKESDLNHAVKILKETGYIKDDNFCSSNDFVCLTDGCEEQYNPNNKEITVCPNCGSDEVVQTKKAGWLFLITSLLFMYPTPFFKKKYCCLDCTQEFKQSRR